MKPNLMELVLENSGLIIRLKYYKRLNKKLY